MKSQKICQYYLQGKCMYGANCKNLHELPQGNAPIPQSSNVLTCKFFLSNSCNRQNGTCNFFHGFGNRLLHLKSIKANDEKVINLIKMDNTKYITSDEKSFIIRFIQNDETYINSMEQEGFEIGKMIYSANKVIMALKKKGQ